MRAPGLDLLRAAAIISVMLYHLSSHGISTPVLGVHGWMGVDLFFVLSGYLVASQLLRRTIENRREHGRFYLDRALRILPAYFAVLALYLLLPASREGGGMQPLWKFITFTINLWPDWSRGTAFSHAWSLCVEAHFYMLLPLALWLLTRRTSGATAVIVVIGIVCAGAALRGWLWTEQVAPRLEAGDLRSAMIQFVAMIYNPSWARLDGLVFGVVLAAIGVFRPLLWARLLKHGRVFLGLGAIIAICCGLITPMSAVGAVILFPLIALGCSCLLIGVLSQRTLISRWPIPGARVFATLAYSLYLTHKQVYAALDSWRPSLGAGNPVIGLITYGAACLLIAGVLYIAVERPGMRLRRRGRPDQTSARSVETAPT